MSDVRRLTAGLKVLGTADARQIYEYMRDHQMWLPDPDDLSDGDTVVIKLDDLIGQLVFRLLQGEGESFED